jgi:hypothetical protein
LISLGKITFSLLGVLMFLGTMVFLFVLFSIRRIT